MGSRTPLLFVLAVALAGFRSGHGEDTPKPAADNGAAGANSKIDDLVNAKLKALGITPSELCMDQELLRRVFLDAIGTLPKPGEVLAFQADKDPQKRSRLIDKLLERPRNWRRSLPELALFQKQRSWHERHARTAVSLAL